MSHKTVAAPWRPVGPGMRRVRRWATCLTITATAVLAGAPAALAVPLPPPDGGGPPPPPPPVTTASHLPLSVVVALVTATIVLSVATTLITLSLEQTRRARRTPAGIAEPQAGTDDILTSHHYRADYDKYRAGSP
jgi:hypothetical protein